MKNEHKAALYSSIVFPGSGYFFTNEKKRGYLCIATCLIILFILMKEAWYKAQIIANKIVYGEITFDLNTIREHIQAIPSIYSEYTLTIVYSTLFIVWLISTMDSYRLAKQDTDAPKI